MPVSNIKNDSMIKNLGYVHTVMQSKFLLRFNRKFDCITLYYGIPNITLALGLIYGYRLHAVSLFICLLFDTDP